MVILENYIQTSFSWELDRHRAGYQEVKIIWMQKLLLDFSFMF